MKGMILPLALAQFIASYAATNMNVAISSIAKDLDTTVIGLQTTITLFTLTMASLMIPGSKLTDFWGRKRCFVIGLVVYGAGALLAAFAQGLALMIIGYSVLEGIGSALMIPPIYILVTVTFPDVKSRARSFGIISGAAGLGAAAGPLIGGVITSAISWRASFILQVIAVTSVILLTPRISDPGPGRATRSFDLAGAVLSAAGLFFVVLGILQSSTYGWFTLSPVWLFIGLGAVILAWFFWHIRARQRAGKEPLLRTRLFTSRTANLGLGTQLIQWLVMQGAFFAISVFLQKVRHYSAIETGLALTPATVGILVSSAAAERFAKRHSQRWLIWVGFLITSVGMILLLALVPAGRVWANSSILTYVPGLLAMGIGTGTMLTSSVNIVQSAFPEQDQDDISGLSRSVSNLGSSLGTAVAGSVLAAELLPGNKSFALTMVVFVVLALAGLVTALLLPRDVSSRSPEAGHASTASR